MHGVNCVFCAADVWRTILHCWLSLYKLWLNCIKLEEHHIYIFFLLKPLTEEHVEWCSKHLSWEQSCMSAVWGRVWEKQKLDNFLLNPPQNLKWWYIRLWSPITPPSGCIKSLFTTLSSKEERLKLKVFSNHDILQDPIRSYVVCDFIPLDTVFIFNKFSSGRWTLFCWHCNISKNANISVFQYLRHICKTMMNEQDMLLIWREKKSALQMCCFSSEQQCDVTERIWTSLCETVGKMMLGNTSEPCELIIGTRWKECLFHFPSVCPLALKQCAPSSFFLFQSA